MYLMIVLIHRVDLPEVLATEDTSLQTTPSRGTPFPVERAVNSLSLFQYLVMLL